MIFKSILKSTTRHLLRDKIYFIINIISLVTGLICCLFILKYVSHEWSFDRFNKEADRIFRIEIETFGEGGTSTRYAYLGVSPVDWIHQIPEIELDTRFAQYNWDMNIDVNEKQFSESGIISADSSFFQLFSFPFIKGDPNKVLATPNSAVISESIAKKYFGSIDVLGEPILISLKQYGVEALLIITGVIEDTPTNSHLSYNIITSADASKKLNGIHINNYTNSYGYIRVSENTSTIELESKINYLYTKNLPESASQSKFHLKRLLDIHLNSSTIGELSTNSNIKYIYLFTLIAILILTISFINYTCLATASSVKRTREIAVRRVFGAEKKEILLVFIFEGILFSIIGLLLTYYIAWFALPYFNELSEKNFSFIELVSPSFLFFMIGISLLIGILAGYYPALILSHFKPTKLFQKNLINSSRGNLLWKSMVVMQIAITIMLISGTYIVQKQIGFIFNKDLGFAKEKIISFQNLFGGQKDIFIQELKKHPNIEEVATSSYIPGVSKTAGMSVVIPEGKPSSMQFQAIVVSPHFFDIYDINLVKGRNFSGQFASDSTQAFIINETAASSLGWEEALGKKINAYGKDGLIIGVVKDFNFVSLHNKIAPMVFLQYDQHHVWISVKIRSNEETSETLSYVENQWSDFISNTPFKYNFVQDDFEAVYAEEKYIRYLFLIFLLFTIVIAMLGLFSFASYTMQQKTREIGIRKVLGASVFDILKQFYKSYLSLLTIGILIAIPISYIWMNNWLKDFSYKTNIGPDTFLIAISLTLLILVSAVSLKVIHGALQNPLDTIRSE